MKQERGTTQKHGKGFDPGMWVAQVTFLRILGLRVSVTAGR